MPCRGRLRRPYYSRLRSGGWVAPTTWPAPYFSWRRTWLPTSRARCWLWTAAWSSNEPSIPLREDGMSDLEEKVKDIIVEELGVEREKLTGEASFMEDLGADSLDTVELVMAFEKEFDIDIPDEEAEKLRTVGDAMSYLHQKIGK